MQGFFFEKEFAIPEDHAKEIIEIVGDAAGQPADGFHPLCLDELRLETLRAFFLLVTLLLREFTTRNFGFESLVGLLEFGSAVAHAKFKSFLGFGEFLLRPLLQGDVADGAEDQDAILALEGAKTDFDGEFRPVFAAAKKLHPRTHHAQTGNFGVFFAIPEVVPAKAVGHEDLHRLAQQLFPLVAKELFGLSVDRHDGARCVHDDHGIRGGFEQGAKLVFGPDQLAWVAWFPLATETVGSYERSEEYAEKHFGERSPVRQRYGNRRKSEAGSRAAVFRFSRNRFRGIKELRHSRQV